MKVLTLVRKPPLKSIVETVMSSGCGALNIADTRIGEGGRWPANLVLQHHPKCQYKGLQTSSGYVINRWKDGAKPFGGGAGLEYESTSRPSLEVPHWDCVPSCPTHKLDLEVGLLKTGSGTLKKESSKAKKGNVSSALGAESRSYGSPQVFYGDSGYASRYFKQVQGETMTDIPEDLLEYLHTLIQPPEGRVVVALDLDAVVWSSYEDESLHGLLFQGDPGEHMEQVWRVLKPGAHAISIGTPEEPTNHTAACALQDQGFEIRDSILLAQEPGRVHYVAKCSPKERHAGVPENAEGKRNFHPTVKPKGIMRRLMEDLPKGAHIVDPFMGSGSTGVACVEAGYGFTGIDLEMGHVKIAEARITFWDAKDFRPWEAEIHSEAPTVKKKPREKVSLLNLRGLE